MRGRLRMTRLPAFEPRERVVLFRARGRFRSADALIRVASDRRRRSGASTAARAAARPPASCSAAATARRPGLRAPAAPTARADARASTDARRSRRDDRRSRANRAGIVAQREVGGVAVVDLVPRQRRRHARVRRRPHRVGARDRAVLGVLVVVEEDAVALLLPPFARRETGRAPLDLAREARARRGAPRRTSSAARCGRRRGCRASRTSSASRPGRGRRAWRARPWRRRGSAATRSPGTGSRSTRSSSG